MGVIEEQRASPQMVQAGMSKASCTYCILPPFITLHVHAQQGWGDTVILTMCVHHDVSFALCQVWFSELSLAMAAVQTANFQA